MDKRISLLISGLHAAAAKQDHLTVSARAE